MKNNVINKTRKTMMVAQETQVRTDEATTQMRRNAGREHCTHQNIHCEAWRKV